MSSCVRESSPQPEHAISQKPEPKRRRFILIRGLRRIFRIKSQSSESDEIKPSCNETASSLDTSISRSIDGLDGNSLPVMRTNLHTPQLSVSHDSVFNPAEQHLSTSEFKSVASLLQDELSQKILQKRKIHVDTDDAEHLQSLHSPIIASGNDLLSSKELINKSSHSTCSDGSFLSVGSSEMDEDSFGAHNSRYSSKISLHDKRTSQTHLDSSDCDSSTSITLSHEVAKHRIAIRPKRNHPRSKKPLTLTNALPATPEVNEENSGRSTSPETKVQTVSTTDGTVTTTSTSTACTVDNGAGPCDLDTSVDEISVANVPRRGGEGFFHRLLSRRSTKKKVTAKSSSAEDVDVDRFLFDEATGARPRQREEPPRAGRMQLSYPPDLPCDLHHHHHQPHLGHIPESPSRANDDDDDRAGGVFERDTFVPIKQSFSIGQSEANDASADDEVTSSNSGGGSSSVQKSLSSDSVSSTALDESSAVGVTAERCRSSSSSDSEHVQQQPSMNGVAQHVPFSMPVPAPRLSKLYSGGGGGGGGGAAEVVLRKKKRDDQQQPELLKVFARRSLKLGKDDEPESLLLANDDDVDYKDKENIVCTEEVVADVGDEVYVVVVDKKHRDEPEVDVNENQTAAEDEVVPQFKGIKQRKQEWEKRLLQQQ